MVLQIPLPLSLPCAFFRYIIFIHIIPILFVQLIDSYFCLTSTHELGGMSAFTPSDDANFDNL